MTAGHLLTLALAALCFLGAAFFAGIEIGVISINRLRLRHLVMRGVRGAAILDDLRKHPDVFLGTTLVGTNLCQVGFTVLVVSLVSHLPWPWVTLATEAAVALVLLAFAEYVPKAWFHAFPSHRSLPFARLLLMFSRVLKPVRLFVAGVVNSFLPARRVTDSGPFVTREELLQITQEGAHTGALTPEENRMIQGVLGLGGRTCREIMVPRDRIVTVQRQLPVADLLDLARRHNFNRIPVQDPASGRMVGVVRVFDVLCDPSSAGKTVADYMRPANFVPDRTLVDHVLPRMRVIHQHIMFVQDERQEVIGLITLDDVLDEIVGEAAPSAPARRPAAAS